MPRSRGARYLSSKEVIQSDIFRIGMTVTLGVSTGAILITCLAIYGSGVTAATVKNIGKIIIDTDAGADDAIAILMVLEAEAIYNAATVVAITCVNGNTNVDNVALNVLKTLKVVDRLAIPVYKGAKQPLLLNDEKTDYFGKDGFGDFDYPDPPSTDLLEEVHAVDAMIELVKANPGEITILALGPLTNIALAIRLYPSFLDDLRQIIILGGSSEGIGSFRPGIEFNFSIDPAANYIVLNTSSSKPAVLVPVETTKRAAPTMEFRTSFNATDNRKVWLMNSAESLTLKPESHKFWECADGIAAAVALSSGEIATKSNKYYLDAIFEGSLTAGMIIVDYLNITQNTPNTNLIQDIDAEMFENMLKKLLG